MYSGRIVSTIGALPYKPSATNQFAPKDIWVAYPLPKDALPLERLVARVVSGQISGQIYQAIQACI